MVEDLRERLAAIEGELGQARGARLRDLEAARDRLLTAICLGVALAGAAERQARQNDDAAFWLRRFYTSLVVGNGAFITLMIANILQVERAERRELFQLISEPLSVFIVGLACASLLPLALALRRGRKGDASGLLHEHWRRCCDLFVPLLAGAAVACLGTGVYLLLTVNFGLTLAV